MDSASLLRKGAFDCVALFLLHSLWVTREMEDLPFKTLCFAGIVLGVFFWMQDKPGHKDGRVPTAVVTPRSAKAEIKKYSPDLSGFSSERHDEEPAVVRSESDEVQQATSTARGHELESEAFARSRLEITKSLASGDVDGALQYAEQTLEDCLQESSSDVAHVGYLHEFILQNEHDPDVEFDVTISALRATENESIRRQLYQKFRAYSPQMMERLDGELERIGLIIQ